MNYIDILKLVEYPETCLVIDFETYYDTEYSLGKISTVEYIQHRMFDFTGMGIQILNDPVVGDLKPQFDFKPTVDVCIKWLQSNYGLNFDAATVVIKNAKFDATILKEKFNIHPLHIIDIDDLLRHYDARMSHRMKDVTEMFGLKPKGKTENFKGLHYEDMDTEKKEALQSYGLDDIDIEADLFKILLPLLTNPTVEIPLARHTLDLYLLPRIRFDFKKAKELQGKMQEKIDNVISEVGVSKTALSGNKSFVKLLKTALPEGEGVPMKLGKRGNIPALAQNDDGCKWLLAHPVEEVRNLMKARQMVKSWPLHIKRIQNMINQAIVTSGKLRCPVNYYGCHTGRWSGGEKINLQNLGGRGRTGSGIDPLIAAMRSLLCAPEMFTFPIVDSAQIEARLLAWIAGQADLLKDFAEGISPYCTFATTLFKEKVWKPTPKEKETSEGQIIAIRYGFGKDSILGCGYGMGAATFYQNCIQNPGLRPLFKKPLTQDKNILQKIMSQHTKNLLTCGIKYYVTPKAGEYDEKFIAYLILKYRTTYEKIPAFWKKIEKAFKWVIKYPHEAMELCDPLSKPGYSAATLKLWKQNTTVHLQLPSGRELTYRHARIDGKGTICWHWGKLWGGSITENIIQAIARDLLGYWILEFEKNHFPVVHHSHDEIITLVRDNDMVALPEQIKLMSQGPAWAEGLPLGAEGELSKVYKK